MKRGNKLFDQTQKAIIITGVDFILYIKLNVKKIEMS